jgi:hypothetical protein
MMMDKIAQFLRDISPLFKVYFNFRVIARWTLRQTSFAFRTKKVGVNEPFLFISRLLGGLKSAEQ